MQTSSGYIGGGMVEREGQIDRPKITIDVDDIDETLATIEELGGSTVLGRQRSATSVGRPASKTPRATCWASGSPGRPDARHVSLHLHRAPGSDQLADGLAELLRDPLPDPFEQELVLVPAKGVERWLSERLSHRLGHGAGSEDGVCAGVQFRSPHTLISELTGTGETGRGTPGPRTRWSGRC